MTAREITKKYKQNVIDLRRKFHQYPEPSLQEYNTCKFIREELDKLGIESKVVGNTGVVAEIKGEKPGKTIALRADIDALTVTELNDWEFKSKNEGLMHGCGHDCHISMLLGAAMVLKDIKDEFKGTVRLIFQPAEEVAKGAKIMIKEGVLEGVDGVFGMHVWSDIEAGSVCVQPGPLMASADMFNIKVTGKGGHGSAPHQGVDAVVVSSAIVMNLQSIVSRELPPLEPTVVSVGSINSGSRFNVIASESILEGTTRCFNPEIKEKFPEIIERVSKNTASTFRAKAEVEYISGTAPVINNEEYSKMAEGSLEKIGAKSIIVEKIMGGEDFSEYQEKVPGILALVGVKNESKNAIYPQHHPHYTVDEDALEIGTSLYVQYAKDFLDK
ncbi:M20 family metallopeptidase [Clostridium sporogenes]|uniref:M20 family metallopeptidase n=1 Tax=Clostridium sporogenes TaxID=1509 RepID=UPI0006B2A358|nr:M20 family metallopeptidase [Clostridium sporogenes]KOY65529.1 peptidase M20 [Clostridium sporogenes]MDS1008879.1 M20 family metallopeptidase [Clostridium sporogenes]NFQ04044.1 amidohydrolase [Clostridium sporogenes]NFQ43396.1 amidohydrolase [Clostridium sporogenes]